MVSEDAVPFRRGTSGSNPSRSSGESSANRLALEILGSVHERGRSPDAVTTAKTAGGMIRQFRLSSGTRRIAHDSVRRSGSAPAAPFARTRDRGRRRCAPRRVPAPPAGQARASSPADRACCAAGGARAGSGRSNRRPPRARKRLAEGIADEAAGRGISELEARRDLSLIDLLALFAQAKRARTADHIEPYIADSGRLHMTAGRL